MFDRRHESKEQYHADQHRKGEYEIHSSGEHGRDGHDEPGEVDLLDETGAADHAVGSAREPASEERPGHEPGEAEHRIGNSVGGHAGEPGRRRC